jgi:hypothetical protein
MRSATHFFACHGVPGEKACLARSAEQRPCTFDDGYFDAANIGYQLMGLEVRGEFLEPILNGEDRTAEQHEVAGLGSGNCFAGDFIHCSAIQRQLRLIGVAVPSDYLAGEVRCSKCESGRSAYEPGADDGYALDGHGDRIKVPGSRLLCFDLRPWR